MTWKIFQPVFIALLFYLFVASCSSGDFDGKNGKRISYYEGTKQIEQDVEYKNGLKEGWWKEYYQNGNLKFKTFYVNDTIKDTSFFYHENGKPASLMIEIQGRKEGCWQKFNKEGKLYSETCYLNDRQEGPSSKYSYNTIRLIEKLNYKRGYKEGRQETYYNSGKKKSVCFFYDSHPCLGLEEWYESGKKVNNDFKISISEENKIVMDSKLKIIVRLENPKKDDRVAVVSDADTGLVITPAYYFIKHGDYFETEYTINRGGYLMVKLKIAAFRKTEMGNTMIKTTWYNLAGNNF